MSTIPKNILFRADSSSTIGTGHIMRDLVLAKQFLDAKIIFATLDLDGNINQKISDDGYKIELLESNDFQELDKLIKRYKIDMIVIDNYAIDYKYEQKLKEENPSLSIMVLDDTYERHHCNILLNHNINADKKKYKGLVPKDCELRCGSSYTLLRDEFLQIFPRKQEIQKINVLVAMGGVDSRELNIKILEALSTFDNLNIDILTTTANKNLDKLKEYILAFKNITLHINSNKVAKLMHESDFAILTPSVTVNEAYFMKLPFIAIKTQENQSDIYEYLKDKNFLVLDKFKETLLCRNIELMIEKLSSKLVNFTKLSLDEKKMILKWRNSPLVKKWMYNREDINFEDHLLYIDSLKNRDDRIYFLVKNKVDYLGVVDLTEIKKNMSAELGIYINPLLKGYGSLLIKKIVNYGFDVLKLKILNANVYEDNTRAINLYKKFNFKIIDSISDSNGKLYRMELKDENR